MNTITIKLRASSDNKNICITFNNSDERNLFLETLAKETKMNLKGDLAGQTMLGQHIATYAGKKNNQGQWVSQAENIYIKATFSRWTGNGTIVFSSSEFGLANVLEERLKLLLEAGAKIEKTSKEIKITIPHQFWDEKKEFELVLEKKAPTPVSVGMISNSNAGLFAPINNNNAFSIENTPETNNNNNTNEQNVGQLTSNQKIALLALRTSSDETLAAIYQIINEGAVNLPKIDNLHLELMKAASHRVNKKEKKLRKVGKYGASEYFKVTANSCEVKIVEGMDGENRSMREIINSTIGVNSLFQDESSIKPHLPLAMQVKRSEVSKLIELITPAKSFALGLNIHKRLIGDLEEKISLDALQDFIIKLTEWNQALLAYEAQAENQLINAGIVVNSNAGLFAPNNNNNNAFSIENTPETNNNNNDEQNVGQLSVDQKSALLDLRASSDEALAGLDRLLYDYLEIDLPKIANSHIELMKAASRRIRKQAKKMSAEQTMMSGDEIKAYERVDMAIGYNSLFEKGNSAIAYLPLAMQVKRNEILKLREEIKLYPKSSLGERVRNLLSGNGGAKTPLDALQDFIIKLTEWNQALLAYEPQAENQATPSKNYY